MLPKTFLFFTSGVDSKLNLIKSLIISDLLAKLGIKPLEYEFFFTSYLLNKPSVTFVSFALIDGSTFEYLSLTIDAAAISNSLKFAPAFLPVGSVNFGLFETAIIELTFLANTGFSFSRFASFLFMNPVTDPETFLKSCFNSSILYEPSAILYNKSKSFSFAISLTGLFLNPTSAGLITFFEPKAIFNADLTKSSCK